MTIHPNFPGYIFNTDGSIRGLRNNTFLGSKDSFGYRITTLKDINSRYKRVFVHRVLLEAFTGSFGNKATVNHIDGNKENNSIDNLEWATGREQQANILARKNKDIKPVEIFSSKPMIHSKATVPEGFVENKYFPGYYAHIDGSIYSAVSNKLIRPTTKPDGYLQCRLRKDNTRKNVYAHRFIAQVYLGLDISSTLTVNHINGDRSDNRVTNLNLMTHSEQSIDQYSRNGKSDEINIRIKYIKEYLELGLTQQDIADKLGCTQATISRTISEYNI